MGFFKKIGKGLKKNISFKNLVKVAGSAAQMIPVAGGLVGGIIDNAQASHEAKKQERQMQTQMVSKITSTPPSVVNTLSAKSDPDFMDILQGAGAGALSGAGAILGGSQTAGTAGASIMDSTLSTWFKSNWYKVVGALAVLGGVIYFAVRKGGRRR